MSSLFEYLQKTPDEQAEIYNQFLADPDAFYLKAEMDQLQASLKMNMKERFLRMTSLMKMQLMFSKARIIKK